MRPALRLLPLTLCIAVSLQAHAADGKSAPTYKLYPLVDAVPAFEDVQKAPEGLNILNNNQLPTDLEGDLLSGTEANPVFNGNVTMRRGDQFMGADQLTFDKAQNRYSAGVAAQTDVLQAQTQLANTRADLAGVLADRAKLEHAIAVLTGVAPGGFTLPVAHGVADAASWMPVVPAVPVVVPSALLQRRPDIAAAERAVEAANAQIGIQRSAYFPQLGLSASVGQSGNVVADLYRASHSLWAVGLSLAQVVFDAGAIASQVEGAKAGHAAAVARYRQTVLVAFQSVEDQLTQAATLAAQEGLRREALAAAERTEQQMLNRYRAGQVGYTEVVAAQASALSARRALLQLQVNRQVAAVLLVQALGGGWQAG